MVQWQKSENGLSFKELEAGSGAMPEPSQTVTIAYKASYLSTGEIIEETAKSRPLGFTLGSDSAPMFQEAVEGMAVGGTRRVMLPPSSKYSSLEEETVQFDLELVAVKTAPEAALFKVQQAVGSNRNLFRLALFSTFLPDILNLLGVAPPGAGASSSTPPTAGPRARSACSAELRAGLHRQTPTHAHEHRQALAMLRLCAVCVRKLCCRYAGCIGSTAHFWAPATGVWGGWR